MRTFDEYSIDANGYEKLSDFVSYLKDLLDTHGDLAIRVDSDWEYEHFYVDVQRDETVEETNKREKEYLLKPLRDSKYELRERLSNVQSRARSQQRGIYPEYKIVYHFPLDKPGGLSQQDIADAKITCGVPHSQFEYVNKQAKLVNRFDKPTQEEIDEYTAVLSQDYFDTLKSLQAEETRIKIEMEGIEAHIKAIEQGYA